MNAKKSQYKAALYDLQVELVKLQKHMIAEGGKVLILFEGRDAAGKDGVIKRIVAHLSPRETRVVALGKPTERDRTSWYFQRWVAHLPAGQELVCFNRSWYNRAGVEPVMGFCTSAEVEEFYGAVPAFERMLVESGIHLFKYYLDIDKAEQKARLKARRNDPLKQWKLSPVDESALQHWDDYSQARNEMFRRTHHPIAPWTVVRADDKHAARLNAIRDLLSRLEYRGKNASILTPDPGIAFAYDDRHLSDGFIAT